MLLVQVVFPDFLTILDALFFPRFRGEDVLAYEVFIVGSISGLVMLPCGAGFAIFQLKKLPKYYPLRGFGLPQILIAVTA